VDVVAAAWDLPPEGSSALLAAMRRRPEWEKIPVLALTDSAKPAQSAAARKAGFHDCQMKFDREQVLESVAQLVSPADSADTEPVCAGKVR
jgi:CheY-like chemotaxis protein